MTTTAAWINFTCMPTLDGAGTALARAVWGGSWEKEVSIRSAFGTLMGQINNNSASHGGPGKPSGGTDFARPFAQANVPVPPYSIECHYKASAWNPGLDWQQAVGRKLAEGPDGAAFGWWTPEAGGAVPDDNAGNDRFNQCVIVVTYQDMQLLTQEELPVVLGQISGRGAVR